MSATDTVPVSVRIRRNLKQAVDAKAADSGLDTTTAAVETALKKWVAGKDPAALRAALQRARTAERERDEALAELGNLRARMAAAAGVPLPPPEVHADSPAENFAAYLKEASAEFPATPAGAMARSGWRSAAVQQRLTWLTDHGYLTRPRTGKYVPVRYRHIDKGVAEAGDAVAQTWKDRRKAVRRGPPVKIPTRTPKPSPEAAQPATARTEPSVPAPVAARKAPSRPRAESRPPVAAKKPQVAAIVQAARDAGHDVMTASQMPPASVFVAGPEVDCPHAGVPPKRVCPECKQRVGGRR